MKMAEYRLKGHEKFHLREGWIAKGIQGYLDNPRVFIDNNGPDYLGVGTNMVKSIRYWLLAFGILSNDMVKNHELTTIGNLIREYDIYLEDYFTLWLLHSQISKCEHKATTWYLFFQKSDAKEFTKEEIYGLLKRELIAYIGTDEFSETSLKDDLDLLLNMYSRMPNDDDPEDKNRSPFASLALLSKTGEIYYRKQPDLRKFEDTILLYEISIVLQETNTASIADIAKLMEHIYHLSYMTTTQMLERLENMGYIKVDRTAGLDVIYGENIQTPEEVIRQYYEGR